MSKNKLIPFLLLGAVLNAGFANADNGGIKVNMVAKEEITKTNDKGEELIELIEPVSVVPGDVIVYTTHYKNIAKETAQEVKITNPIPKEVAYQEGSAKGDNTTITFSIDGGKTYNTPDKLTVTDEADNTRPATPLDYTNIQWLIPSLAPDLKGEVSFRAKLR